MNIIGVASGYGSIDTRCEHGPELLLVEKDLSALLEAKGFKVEEIQVLYPKFQLQETLSIITDLNQRLSHLVEEAKFPLVIGGDHSIAMGTWSGVAKKGKQFGLVWIDAHMDAHTPETTPSGMWCGMPVAFLLQNGIVSPKHLCEIAVRSYEKEERELLESIGVKVFYMDEIRKRGVKAILEEAIHLLSQEVDYFGLSIDLDAFDPEVAPGVFCKEPGGLLLPETLEALTIFQKMPNLLALEIVEFNPFLDHKSKTERLILEVIACILKK